MKKILSLALMLALAATSAQAAELTVKVGGVGNGQPIPPKYAYCVATPTSKSEPKGQNISPKVSWSKGPYGTRTYALVMVDPDVPTVFDDAGKEGKTLSKNMKRQDYYHWAVVDIPVTKRTIPEGRGKDGTTGRSGLNDYPKFMGLEKTAQNIAKFSGYDGPCPPWNDERVHHYHFKVFALDVDSLNLGAPFTGKEAMDAMASHILATGEVVGTYTLNPALKGK